MLGAERENKRKKKLRQSAALFENIWIKLQNTNLWSAFDSITLHKRHSFLKSGTEWARSALVSKVPELNIHTKEINLGLRNLVTERAWGLKSPNEWFRREMRLTNTGSKELISDCPLVLAGLDSTLETSVCGTDAKVIPLDEINIPRCWIVAPRRESL
ncbi:hypothetical protein K502DRAFT_353636 [Neoconidiobolus thromboides FSU 785]|nr:hypothetical protein K502DRAFT_353636 [Neoconidiobolus thromboides FSU 785]